MTNRKVDSRVSAHVYGFNFPGGTGGILFHGEYPHRNRRLLLEPLGVFYGPYPLPTCMGMASLGRI